MAPKTDTAMILHLQPEELTDQRPEQTKKNLVKGHNMIASNSKAAPPSPVAPPAVAPPAAAPKSPTLMEIIRTFSNDSEMSTEHFEVSTNYRQEDESLSEFWDRRDKRIQRMCDADDSDDSIFHYGLHRN
jgi:hypothetical protein